MRSLIFAIMPAIGLVAAASPSSFAAPGADARLGPAAGVRVDVGVGLDLDLDALHLSTFTDTLPGDAAAQFHARAGDTVRRVYVVRNDGLLPLTEVSVIDPDVAPSAINCARHDDSDDADDPDLGPLSWMVCSASFPAAAGTHATTVTATATSAVTDRRLSAQDTAAYTAITPGLSASVTFQHDVAPGGSMPADTSVSAAVRIANSGSAQLAALRVVPPPSISGLTCPAGPAVGDLDPGESVVCTGSLSTAAGRHEANVIVTGDWRWDRPITSQGPQFARGYPIQATADAGYVGIAAPSPPPSPVAPAARSRAASVPRVAAPAPSPPPSPPAPPSPTPPHSPTPAPHQALPPSTAQFATSRGLSLPLKVLAIVIIPGVAVARRFASRR